MAKDNYTNYQGTYHINASDFFMKMRKKAEKLAEDMALERTSKMIDILRHRKIMENVGGALGRWPKWNGDSNKKSKGSFQKWEARYRGKGEYWLINTANGGDGIGYNYVRALATGIGWNVNNGSGKKGMSSHGPYKKLVANGDGKYFSTQLPNGLNPWLKHQRKLFEADLLKELKTKGIV